MDIRLNREGKAEIHPVEAVSTTGLTIVFGTPALLAIETDAVYALTMARALARHDLNCV